MVIVNTINNLCEINTRYPKLKQNNDGYDLYINIDRGYLVPEYIISRIYNLNPHLRTKIAKNTMKTIFSSTNKKLIPIKAETCNLNRFLASTQNITHVYYITNRPKTEYPEIKQDLHDQQMPTGILIHSDDLNLNKKNNNIIIVDSDASIINKFNINNQILFFKLNIIE